MRRTFGLDVLACPRCGGRLRLVALIEQAAVVQRILRHLSLPAEVPEPRPPRAPPTRLETLEAQSRDAPELEAAWSGRRVPRGGVSARRVVPVPRRRFRFRIPAYLAIIGRRQGPYPRCREGGGLRTGVPSTPGGR
jgi:uncharacterized protein YbaR (Trm112 family)